jgi:hypothetical protein
MSEKYTLPEKRSHHRARIITTAEGRFMHVGDCREALNDQGFVLECLAVLKVGVEGGRPHLEAFQRALANAFFELSGEPERKARP